MDPSLRPEDKFQKRFAAELDELVEPDERTGVAVSGGPDSVALLLLAAATRPGQIQAATIDHQLRPESAAEARFVASLCKRLGVPHATLAVDISPGASLQARARNARYRALADWANEESLAAIATAHHADDQAETLLMRLARGAGLSGLAATRRIRQLDRDVMLVRPLLSWRRAELAGIVRAANIQPIDDPTNRDPRHDRSRFRGLVERSDWAEADRLASSALWLAEAEEAIEWSVDRLAGERLTVFGDTIGIDPAALPRELQRRLLLIAFDRFEVPRPRGPQLERAMRSLGEGGTASLSGLKLVGGTTWQVSRAPARKPR
ncbi:tRNA lysidine(34) synthetase TilS [Sphingomonas sp. HDW15A]|uniref:tRNA lysidine(34) synthetase TilS n=1 Tax=Sphingomonas sp. HDW15A TaxID=2714942 RepID=UPI0014076C8E|nr:tRNA lysidine(34) synthetase TilS [Sphingomonas sp. HDW15A]QIK96679.1 tRNA lysidine(34) synthetase TilS [Sphingomonas sp. HDW15A]